MKRSIFTLILLLTLTSVFALNLNIESNGADIESVDVMNNDNIVVTADQAAQVSSASIKVELLQGDESFYNDLMSIVNDAMAKTNYKFTGSGNTYSVDVSQGFSVNKNILDFPAKVPDSMGIKLTIEMMSESGDYERELVLKLRKDQLFEAAEENNAVMGSQFYLAKKLMTGIGGLLGSLI